MTLGSETFALIKKIFLVSEELTRLSAEVKELSRDSNNHEVRLAVIETKLAMTNSLSKLILPGN